jgi:hypothetical protein
MVLITRRDVIRNGIRSFIKNYSSSKYQNKWLDVANKLSTLDPETCAKEDVNDIIGNNSWTSLLCHECCEDCDVVVQLGQEPDYESMTANVCADCLTQACALCKEIK